MNNSAVDKESIRQQAREDFASVEEFTQWWISLPPDWKQLWLKRQRKHRDRIRAGLGFWNDFM
ncbi:hypothetical protein GCM10027346_42860 [Hymenobacter seoulensis]